MQNGQRECLQQIPSRDEKAIDATFRRLRHKSKIVLERFLNWLNKS